MKNADKSGGKVFSFIHFGKHTKDNIADRMKSVSYTHLTDLEKKEFLNSFVEQVDIYEQEQPDGRFLKHVKFRFPVCFGDRETQELCWDNESTVESIVLLSRK